MSKETRNLSRLQIWLLASRPKTLWASVTPIVMGGALALADGKFHGLTFSLALICAVFLQVGANLANDLFDFVKGADSEERVGPLRVTQAGLVTQRQITMATGFVFLLAMLAGVYLIYRGGWPFAVLGATSILLAILYTGGPWPLGYLGLGDLFVLIYFGPVAVTGTYYLCSLQTTPNAWLAGIQAGMISVAILTVNNFRDRDSDALSGKKTLVVRFGESFARAEFLVMTFGAVLLSPLHLLFRPESGWVLLSLIMLLPALKINQKLLVLQGPELNQLLAETGKFLAGFGLLFSVGVLL